jgi:hypothetical protein
MKLLIAGKYIEIKDFVELITENPIINNFDQQLAQYSNSFEVKYNGDIVDLLDISKLRKSTSPYLLTEGYLIDGVIFIPITIIINSFDPNKNTIKMNVTERIISGISGGINIRTTKLTELRHKLDQTYYAGDDTEVDEIILDDGTRDKRWGMFDYIAETEVISDTQTYPHAITPANSCPRISLLKFCDFLEQRYGVVVENAPDIDFFANKQLPFSGDLVQGSISLTNITSADVYITPATLTDFPAGIKSNGFLDLTTRQLKYTNKIGSIGGYFLSGKVTVNDIGYDQTKIKVYFKGTLLDLISVSGQELTFGIADRETELFAFVAPSGSDSDRVISFRVTNTEGYNYAFDAYAKFYISMSGNDKQATDDNSRQVFQNMPDVTILDLFKLMAKASAKYIEITNTGLKFINIADSLLQETIIDASEEFILINSINYTLYNVPSLEYWYKDAEVAALIVPISDVRVKGEAKKIEIDLIMTDDANVALFEDDGIKPLEGIATFPFLNIADASEALTAFYLSIQNPFLVTATFRNFNVGLSSSILIRQLNGRFVPKKIIRTNRDTIELELLKIES